MIQAGHLFILFLRLFKESGNLLIGYTFLIKCILEDEIQKDCAAKFNYSTILPDLHITQKKVVL